MLKIQEMQEMLQIYKKLKNKRILKMQKMLEMQEILQINLKLKNKKILKC